MNAKTHSGNLPPETRKVKVKQKESNNSAVDDIYFNAYNKVEKEIGIIDDEFIKDTIADIKFYTEELEWKNEKINTKILKKFNRT